MKVIIISHAHTNKTDYLIKILDVSYLFHDWVYYLRGKHVFDAINRAW